MTVKFGLLARASGAALALLAAAPAWAAPSRTTLPIPPEPFAGVVGRTVADSRPDMPRPVTAPRGAPNIFLLMADDVGFSMSSSFGGPVPTPNMDRLAATGLRYNRFHTTGICSASRAALLTGRNHHNAATGHLADLPMGFPGYTARIPRSTATIAEVLKLNGFNTAMFGKHHNVPPGEQSAAGPFDHWPTGLGFEYFYGVINGESDQWHPVLQRGISPVFGERRPGELLEKRLADDAIRWVHDQKAAAPDKPFFIYYSTTSTHAPHQAPPDLVARFHGKFDQGWDKVREQTWRRQLAQGVIPRGTVLTPRPAGIAAWASLSPTQQAFAARGMEVAAAMLAYQDEQLGRILDEFERMGLLDNTLFVVIQGDNGASGDGDLAGVVSEFGAINGVPEDSADESWMTSNLDKLGGEETYSSYAEGWGWAMNAPFPMYKQYASMLGGIRDGMIVSWKGHVAKPASLCAEFGHLVDIAPTLFEAAGVPAPESVNGAAQKPLDGESLLASLASCDPDRPRTQYFELSGQAGLYHDGWFISNKGGAGTGEERWKLYNLKADFSQAHDLSGRYPGKVAQLVALWEEEAERNHVFPIRPGLAQAQARGAVTGRASYEFWSKDSGIPAHPDGLLLGRGFRGSFTIDARLRLDGPAANGVIAALGSHFAGWSLYLDQGRPVFAYARSTRPEDRARIAARQTLPRGASSVRLAFRQEGRDWRAPAHVEILADGAAIASGEIPAGFFIPLGAGERLDVGRDTGVPVTDYASPVGELEGEVDHLKLVLH